jgi:hypothetical protein
MRIELQFDDRGAALVEEMKALTGLKTHKDFFNNSVVLFDWALLQVLQRRIVASMDERDKNYKELVMPALQYAAASSDEVRMQALQRRGVMLATPAEVAAVDLRTAVEQAAAKAAAKKATAGG